jgi:hypothetical protein
MFIDPFAKLHCVLLTVVTATFTGEETTQAPLQALILGGALVAQVLAPSVVR